MTGGTVPTSDSPFGIKVAPGGVGYVAPTLTPDIYYIGTPTPMASPTSMASPTLAVSATPMASATPPYMTFQAQYSYYWPPLLGPNCHPANLLPQGGCKDTTSSGLPWSHYRGRGVAIPLTWQGTVPLLSVIRVLLPVEMMGDYLVIDYCGLCTKAEYPGLIWLDFLDDHLRLPWSADMSVIVLPPGLVDVSPIR